MNKTVRWGIVGTGGIARRTIGDLRLCDNVELRGICSRNEAKAKAFAEEHGIPVASGDFDQFCGSGEVDAVYIGIPHEPLFAPRSIRLMTGKPPGPPSVEEFSFEREGAGYVPMFRAASQAILDGAIEPPRHPMADTISVLRTLERVRADLAAKRRAKESNPWYA